MAKNAAIVTVDMAFGTYPKIYADSSLLDAGTDHHSDHTQWKWTYKNFKDYLINQVKKAGIDVQLKTTAAPEMIKAKGCDTVLAATGAEPVISKMRGAFFVASQV